MKLYTKTGDDGSTGLFGGERVSKDHPRVEAYGSVDELNAALGLAAAALDADDERVGMLRTIQSRLFDIGADLATPAGSRHEGRIHRVEAVHAEQLEAWIDEIDGANEPMRHFVLPGGTEAAARLHLARTICRRAERRVIALGHAEPVTEQIAVYLNRLSDLLFALARRSNALAGVADIPWEHHE